jgi:hypothetical protein
MDADMFARQFDLTGASDMAKDPILQQTPPALFDANEIQYDMRAAERLPSENVEAVQLRSSESVR